MQYSPVFKSSPHCLPSPNGKFIATILPSEVSIRAVETLDVVRTIKLRADLAAAITTFAWSPTAESLLLSTNDEIHVYSAPDGDLHATMRNSSTSGANLSFVNFGATNREACVCSAHGITLSLFNLASLKTIEISNPKFYTASSATRGTCGKDTVSIHAPESRQVQRSWSPDLVDAQGLSWTPDGRWLILWESAAQGHRVIFYTPDGHKYKDWRGSLRLASSDMHGRGLGAGVRLVAFSSESQYMAIGDYSRCISVLPLGSLTDELQLCHPHTIEPKDTLQIWQEQLDSSHGQSLVHMFARASQPVAPVVRMPSNAQELRTGPLFILFDSSAALLAVALEDAPSTLWIWDVSVSELRAVLIFHAEISRVEWHPSQPELLLVKCEGQDHAGKVFVWDPLSEGPRAVDFTSHFAGNVSGRSSAYWLQLPEGPASLFFTDSESYLLGSMAGPEDGNVPWRLYQSAPSASSRQAARSPLSSAKEHDMDDSDMGGDASQLDDTFQFKKLGTD
ncbi:hypothetical protein TruAng_008327 [Truncatella angustata]|nr:hypothetical protein TruAng_008327 [Truncatella angustata]